MFRNVFTKTLFSLRWQLLGWFVAVVFVAFITMALFTSLSQHGIEGIINSVPDSLKSLIGSVADFTTVPGYIGQQVFGPNIIILTIIMAIVLFTSISSQEEDRGNLQTLLSFPVSRSSIYFQKLLAVLIIIALVSLAIVLGVAAGLLVVDKSADFSRIFASSFAAWLLNTGYGIVAYAVAMATGKKSLTIAVASGYAFLSFIISTLAPSVDKLSLADKFSLLHYYNNPQIMSSGLNWTHILVLSLVIIVLAILGWLGFTKRDVRS